MTSMILKELLVSGAPAQVLEFVLLNPRERLFQSDLGTRLAFAPLRLLIPRLVQAGFLTQEEEEKKIYYQANPGSPIFAELMTLFMEYRGRNGTHRTEVPTEAQDPGLGRGGAEREESEPVLGTARSMEEVRRLIARLAPLEVALLVRGESGTGKVRVARAVHRASGGNDRPFFPVDCSTLSEPSLDALLFGQERRSLASREPGLLGSPGGATVLLREIEALSLPLQQKVLRAVEERQYVPVDGLSPLPVRARLIFSSRRVLSQLVEEETFLYELYSKLALYEIWIPPLRDRIEDLPLLARHLIGRWCDKTGRPVPVLEQEAELALMNRPWRGNVQELSDVLERTLQLLAKPSIGVSDLPEWPGPVRGLPPENLREARHQFEREHVARILEKYAQDKIQAAKALNVDVSTVYRLTHRLAMKA